MSKAKELLELLSENKFTKIRGDKFIDIWTSKPPNFKEIKTIALSSLPSNEVSKLQRFTDVEVYGKKVAQNDVAANLQFKMELPIVFILETSFGNILVSTEGYKYARDIVKIK
jgi:hypothetical protein|tara:strand:+ start:174 stop:512 length:339 start_codon:yes stop_codon:yes gene_type:complete